MMKRDDSSARVSVVCEEANVSLRSDVMSIGLVIPLQGPAGVFAPSCEAAAELAAAQMNASDGICGRQVAIEVIEGGDHPSAVAERVHGAVRAGRIEAVTGWHISPVRQRLAPRLQDQALYVYTSLYEGGEGRREVVCSGEVPQQQILPALAWLRDRLGLRRWCIVGDDYLWPRASAKAAREYCSHLGLDIVDQFFVPYGTENFAPVVERVARSNAQAVLMLLVGQDGVLFNREFADLDLHGRMVRFSPLMDENMLLASGAEATANLYVAAAYFSSLATAGAMDLMDAYTARYGPEGPPLNNMAESCYEGILMLRALHNSARSHDLSDLLAVRTTVAFDGPRGTVGLSGELVQQNVYLATADGVDFDVIDRLNTMA